MSILRWLFGSPTTPKAPAAPVDKNGGVFSTDTELVPTDSIARQAVLATAVKRSIQRTPTEMKTVTVAQDGAVTQYTGDSNDWQNSAKAVFMGWGSGVPDVQLMWYASQGFIGYQMAAIMAQHWLIDKACSMPAKDAARVGFTITGVDSKVAKQLEAKDKEMKLADSLVEFVRFGRVFGIRIAMFQVDSEDPLYYEKPFNPDGITAGSYKGIVQIDPYWTAPELGMRAASDPMSKDFYEPTYWLINGRRIHRSHLIICRPFPVVDVLKPTYRYGGVSVPQRIYERVYAAERTANEAPQLTLTKRAMIFYTDAKQALANQVAFTDKLLVWAGFRDNYGVKVADKEADKIEQHDTSLADLDAVIMSQYQIVSAIAEVPVTKLMGTQLKGFSTGDGEEASYHEFLESVQVDGMTPLIERHHLILQRSLGLGAVRTGVAWNPLDALTSEELAKVNLAKAQADDALVTAGALDGADIRKRLAADKDSGYTGIDITDVPEPPEPTLPPQELPTSPNVHALDGSDFDAATGRYDGADLISNQTYRDPERILRKRQECDYRVQLSPAFTTPAGQLVRIILDGHHSLAAAMADHVTPTFEECDYGGSDYTNVVTGASLV